MARETRVVEVKLHVGRRGARGLYGYADPDTAVMCVGDTIRWKVVAKDGVRNVKPANFRLVGTCMDPLPFPGTLRRSAAGSGASFTTTGREGGFRRIYKYDIMVGSTVVADPDVQIKER